MFAAISREVPFQAFAFLCSSIKLALFSRTAPTSELKRLVVDALEKRSGALGTIWASEFAFLHSVSVFASSRALAFVGLICSRDSCRSTSSSTAKTRKMTELKWKRTSLTLPPARAVSCPISARPGSESSHANGRVIRCACIAPDFTIRNKVINAFQAMSAAKHWSDALPLLEATLGLCRDQGSALLAGYLSSHIATWLAEKAGSTSPVALGTAPQSYS